MPASSILERNSAVFSDEANRTAYRDYQEDGEYRVFRRQCSCGRCERRNHIQSPASGGEQQVVHINLEQIPSGFRNIEEIQEMFTYLQDGYSRGDVSEEEMREFMRGLGVEMP